MRKIAMWFAACLLTLPAYAATQLPGLIKDDICQAFEIMHINGVTTSLEQAQNNLTAIRLSYGNAHQDHLIRYGLAYNQTNTAVYDFAQSYRQILALYPGTTQAEWLQAVITGQWPNSLPPAAITQISGIIAQAIGMGDSRSPFEDRDLTAVENAILGFHRRGSRLTIVGHSQGTLFSNQVFDRLLTNWPSYFIADNLGQVSIAAVANTIRKGTHITSSRDALVGAVRLVFPDVLQWNRVGQISRLDLVGHNLINIYLTQPNLKVAVTGAIASITDSLRSPNFPSITSTTWPPAISGWAAWNNCEPGKSTYTCTGGRTTGGEVYYGLVGTAGIQITSGSYSEIMNRANSQATTCVALLTSARIARVSAGGPAYENPAPNIFNCAAGYQYAQAVQMAWLIYSAGGMDLHVPGPPAPESYGYAEVRVYPVPVCRAGT